jgi:hypothetical protein
MLKLKNVASVWPTSACVTFIAWENVCHKWVKEMLLRRNWKGAGSIQVCNVYCPSSDVFCIICCMKTSVFVYFVFLFSEGKCISGLEVWKPSAQP